MSNVGKSLADPFQQPWDDDEPFVLMLYEAQARSFGVSEADIEAARERALPCPPEWPVPHGALWKIIGMIPKHVGTWEGVKFHERKRRKR